MRYQLVGMCEGKAQGQELDLPYGWRVPGKWLVPEQVARANS